MILPLNRVGILHLMRACYWIFYLFYGDKVPLIKFRPFLPWIAYKRRKAGHILFLCCLSILHYEIICELRLEFICVYYMSSRETPASGMRNPKFIFKPIMMSTNPESVLTEEHYVPLKAEDVSQTHYIPAPSNEG